MIIEKIIIYLLWVYFSKSNEGYYANIKVSGVKMQKDQIYMVFPPNLCLLRLTHRAAAFHVGCRPRQRQFRSHLHHSSCHLLREVRVLLLLSPTLFYLEAFSSELWGAFGTGTARGRRRSDSWRRPCRDPHENTTEWMMMMRRRCLEWKRRAPPPVKVAPCFLLTLFHSFCFCDSFLI